MIRRIGSASHCRRLAEAYGRFIATGSVPAFPARIHLQTQSRCNAACAMCPHPYVSKNWDHGVMSWGLFQSIAGELATAPRGTTLLVDLQNEPLLNPDVFAWFHNAAERAPQVRRVLTTNGELLHRFSVADIADACLNMLAVSLNAHSRQTYERVNCGLDFERVVNNILMLAKVPALRPLLRVDFVETELNQGELDAAGTFWREQGIATYVKPLSNRAGVLHDYGSLVPGRTSARPAWGERLVAGLKHRLGCPHPFYEMSVLYNGDVLVCCHDWGHSRTVGNVTETPIRDVWNSYELRSVRRSLLAGRARSMEPCAGCSLA